MEIDEIIREIDVSLQITKKEIREKMLYIYCHRASEISNCPNCGSASSKVHSRYKRELSDLPISHYKVKLIIEVKKYICENADCTHKRFAESLPFAGERAKRTERLDDYIMEIGMKNSSVETAKIIQKTHADISNQTVLRVIKKS